MPRISVEDSYCVWIGAEVGDIVLMEKSYEATNISTSYAVVIKATEGSAEKDDDDDAQSVGN
jgi:hypothetical protein